MTEHVIIIGGGPAGYVAALRAAQLGFQVTLVESRETLGGTCLNVGCIPSKALLASTHKVQGLKNLERHGISYESFSVDLSKMMDRKEKIVKELAQGIDFLMKKKGVQVLEGIASFKDSETLDVRDSQGNITQMTGDFFVIASGSEPVSLPGIPVDEQHVVTSTGALSFPHIPKSLGIIGGGYIGLEMASIWSRLGTKVTVFEEGPEILPNMDKEVRKAMGDIMRTQGVEVMLDTHVVSIENQSDGMVLQASVAGERKEFQVEKLLVAVGRRARVQELNLEAADVEVSERGFLKVNEHFQTSQPHILAIGDVIGGAMLAHKASEEGMTALATLAGLPAQMNYHMIPAVMFTSPEVACVGATEDQLIAQGRGYSTAMIPLRMMARAKTNGEVEGFVKLLADAQTKQLLGCHMIAENAGEMIGQIVTAMEFGATLEDIASLSFPHPTLSEGVRETALKSLSRGLHF